MAGFPVAAQGGPNSAGAINPKDANALIARLRSSAPAVNPGTPSNRMDSTTERLQSCNQVRVSLEKLMTTINEDETVLKSLVIAMHAVINKILAGVDPQQILSAITMQLGQANAPAGPTPPMGQTAGMPGAPPSPQGASSPAAMPVSPGPPGN